jgi:hydrogenase maturation protein HypF
MDHRRAVAIRVRGLVQGVGFRPFVHRVAIGLGLAGDVLNDGEGVLIRVAGDASAIAQLVAALETQAPSLARVTAVEQSVLETPVEGAEFRILASGGGRRTAGVVPDAALCDDCRAEIDDPGERRYRYGFASCTQCGPRFSIVEGIPYDRGSTTMRGFRMCAACQAEYDDPLDRRFHAQPIACPDCGPMLRVCDPAGEMVVAADAMTACVEVLRAGGTVGIKGLGGYHLACDAANGAAVMTLRERKRRPVKPFALMAPDLGAIARYGAVDEAEAALLRGSAAPIVLLRRAGVGFLAPSVAPGQAVLGWMLPTTPLHHLLLDAFGGPLVMTSGNRSGEPQAISDDEAVERLGRFVDLFLMHDRPIARRLDDSVAVVVRGETRLVRRARGYAPAPLGLPDGFGGAPPVLAVGGDLKAAICLTQDGAALLSHHLGDLEDALTFQTFEQAIDSYAELFAHCPTVLACDLHSGYLSSAWARERARRDGLTLTYVQHHHAHVVSVMAERRWPLDGGPVVGIVLDGLGYGTDETVWGGEILLCGYERFRRLARLRPVPMPGGRMAVIEPWRNLVAHLDAAFGEAEADLWLARLGSGAAILGRKLAVLRQSVARGLNAPLGSSCGRLFDAVAVALGVAPERLSFEGEAAMALEALAAEAGPQRPYPFGVSTERTWEIDAAPMWAGLLADLADGMPAAVVAARFHAGLAEVFCRLAADFAVSLGARAVALGGGCFQNRILLEACERKLAGKGLAVLVPAEVPANDGGLALGQALVAAARALSE